MKTQMHKGHWKKEDYSDHCDNSYRVDSHNEAAGKEKKPDQQQICIP